MPRQYKKKFYPRWWSWNERPKSIKKQINSSERWRGKRDIQKQLNQHYDNIIQDEIDELHEHLDKYYNSTPCVNCLTDYAILDKLAHTLMKFKIIVITDYKRDKYSCIHKADTATTALDK